MQTKRPLIAAQDLIQLGIATGPQMGALLKKAEDISINENFQDKEIILKRILQP